MSGVTACIVQARLGSSRLPAKVLLPLPTGRTVLEEVLWRCSRISGIDVVVLAIPDTPENDIIVQNGLKRQSSRKIQLVRGPEHDVLARYAKAAETVNADVIMRITADCPLIDPQVCGQVLAAFRDYKYECCSNTKPRTWPQGLDCEVFSASALRLANKYATKPYDREHVTPFLQSDDTTTISHNVVRKGEDLSHLRWTLDTIEDYVRIWGVMEEQMRAAA